MAGSTSQRTGRMKAPARIATPAAITATATTVSPPGRGRPGAADRYQPADAEDADAERGPLGDVARLAGGSLA